MLDRTGRRLRHRFSQTDRSTFRDKNAMATGTLHRPQDRTEVSRIFDAVKYYKQRRIAGRFKDLVAIKIICGRRERNDTLMIDASVNKLLQSLARNCLNDDPVFAGKVEYFIKPMLSRSIGNNDLLDPASTGPQGFKNWERAEKRVRRWPLLKLRTRIEPLAVMRPPLRPHINSRRIREYLVNCVSFEMLSPIDRSNFHPTRCIPFDVLVIFRGHTWSRTASFAMYETSKLAFGNEDRRSSFNALKFSTASKDLLVPRQEKSNPCGRMRKPR
jgi:hypothetical protein